MAQTKSTKPNPSEAPTRSVGVQRLVMFLRDLFTKEQEIFLTHTLGDWCQVGTTHDKDGIHFVVTSVKRESNTALFNGGSAPCWSIRGKPLRT